LGTKVFVASGHVGIVAFIAPYDIVAEKLTERMVHRTTVTVVAWPPQFGKLMHRGWGHYITATTSST